MNSRARVVAALTVILAVGVVLSGCGSSKLIITVLVSPASPTVLEGKTQAFTATLTNDTTSKGVNWTVTCSVSNCGMLGAVTTTSVTYTAPGPVASNLTVTLTASSVADTTKTGTANITVPAIAVAVAPTSATVNAGSSTTITPTVTNDPSATPNVTWTVSCSTAPCGSVSPASTASGTATTYTAPTTPPASNLTVTVTATSAADTTKSASSTITVPAISVAISPPTPTVLEGQTQLFTATVSGTSNQNVTWILTCGVASCGTLSNNTSNPTTYTAPGPPASNLTVTITARPVADPTKSASTSITVPAITVGVAPTSATVNVNTTQNFTATVANDPANSGVTWTLSGSGCTGAACGTLSAASSASGTPITYKAPATVPTPATVTLTVTSVTDTTKSSTATVTIVPPIKVAVAPTSANVPVEGTQAYTATVSNDAANKGVTWTLTQGGTVCSPGCGTITATTASGAPATYAAPNTIPGNPTITITATSVTDSTKTGTATATVVGIMVSVSPTSVSVVVNATHQFTATVTNDVSNGGVTWTLTQGGVPCAPTCGTVAPTTTASGAPTTYTAPATVPSPPTVTLTAASVDNGTKVASATITVISAACGSGSESLLSGQYVFLLKGFDSSGNPALIVGVLDFNGIVNNGLITSGTIDMNLNPGVQSNLTVSAASSSYSVGSDHRGCMTIATSAGTNTYRFSLGNISSGVASMGHMIDFDSAGPFTAGTLRKQAAGPFSTATINGSYAFGGSSIQNAAVAVGGGKLGVVGVINFNGSGGVTGGSEDINQNGTLDGNTANMTFPASPITINSGGTYTVGATTGRGTLAVTVVGSTATFHSVFYLVSSSEALFMTSDPQTTNTIVGGQVLQQSGGPFALSSLHGTSVIYLSGIGGSGGTRAQIGLVTTDGSGGFTFSATQNDNGTISTQAPTSGTYSVDTTTGRVLLPSGGGTHPPVFYLVKANEMFVLGSNGKVDSGFFEPQSGSPFTNSSANGTYAFGTINPEGTGVNDSTGVATFTPATTSISVTSDSSTKGSQNPNQTMSFTYTIDSTGLGHIPANCTIGSGTTVCQTIFLVISPTKAVVIDVAPTTTGSNPNVQVADQ